MNPAPDCPVCEEPLERMMIPQEQRLPFTRLGLCLYCGAVIRHDERPIRALTQAELRAFDPDDRASLEYAQRVIRRHNKFN